MANRIRELTDDRSVTALLLSNGVTIVIALVQQWQALELIWIYWGQSVIIGYFNVHRILALDKFSASGFTMNNKPVKPGPESKRQVARFFAMHYGFFHLMYGVFLAGFSSSTHSDLPLVWIIACIILFYFNHRYSYRYHQQAEQPRIPNIGNLMAFPYVRIVPMHLMILLGGTLSNNTLALLLFMLLKTVADVAMHYVEHAMAKSSIARARRRLP